MACFETRGWFCRCSALNADSTVPTVIFYEPKMSNDEDSSSSDTETETKESQFLSAVLRNDFRRVTEFIDEDVDVNYTERNQHAMCISASRGNVAMCRLLASNYCELDHADISDSPWFRQPIHFAAARGHADVTALFLSLGINPDVRDADNRTPLYWAATYDHVDVAKVLVQGKADINTAHKDGFTALHAATCLGKVNMCEFLLSVGARVDQVDVSDGWSALHAAVCYDRPQVIGRLLQADADVNCVTHDGDTPLHIAADLGNLNTVRLLCQRGAVINAKSAKGMTPLYLAVNKGHLKIIKYLIKQGADLDTVTEVGYSPIIMAVTRGHYHIVQLLAQSGCDLNDLHYVPLSTILRNKYLRKPRSLFEQTCIIIRRCIGEGLPEKGRSLPLPQKCRDIITFSDLVVDDG